MVFLTVSDSLNYLFDFNYQLIADSVLTLIAVFVLVTAMSYFLFNPARQVMKKRQEKIKDEIDDAKDNMERAQALKDEYESKIDNIDKEAELILNQARKRALDNENHIVARAKVEAALIIERAQRDAQLEKDKMADEIKREIITIASLMAGKVVTASIDTALQNSLIEETLKEMGENTWLS